MPTHLKVSRLAVEFLDDFRYAIRCLLKNRGFSLVAIGTLALGIGANTAIFTYLNAIFFKPLAYQDPDSLVGVSISAPDRGTPTALEFRTLRERTTVFSHLSAVRPRVDMNVAAPGFTERVHGAAVSANYFEMLGISAARGRTFIPGEDELGKHQVAVINDRLWRRAFGGNPAVVGMTIRIDSEPYTLIGILPPGVFDRDQASLWRPLAFTPDELARFAGNFRVLARLKAGVTVVQAKAELDPIVRAMKLEDFFHQRHKETWAGQVRTLREAVAGSRLRTTIQVLFGAVLLVLLIACANVANLLLARSTARRREIATRLALGAGRARLSRQFMTESFALSLPGGAAGLFLAFWLMRAAPAFIPVNYLPSEAAIGIDYVVLCFTLILCAGTAVLFGLVPVWRLCGLRASSDRGATLLPALARAATRRLRGALLISEVAIAFVLVVGAGLLIRSFTRLIAVDPGVERENLLTFQTTLSPAVYPARVQVLSFQEELLKRIAQVPGIKSAGAADLLPLGGTLNAALYEYGADAAIVRSTNVTPGYASATGVRMLNGRWFSDADNAGAPHAAVVNQTFVKRFFPGRNVLGQVIRVLPRGDMTIIGVVADVNLFVLERKVDPTVFEPYAQFQEDEVSTHRRMNFLVRTEGDPARVAPTIRALAAGIDKEQPLSDFATFHEVVAKSVERPRFHVGILSAFGGLALLLAVIGVYGVLHYSVLEMRREIGIRIAIGATAWDILLMVLRRGMLQVAAGLIIGLGGCWALTRVLQSYLFETTPNDAATLASVAAAVTCAALAACIRPAWAATRIDPIVELRCE